MTYRPYKPRNVTGATTFEGKPCAKAGHTKRYSANNACVACAIARSIATTKADRARATELQRNWRRSVLADPVAGHELRLVERARAKKYYEANRERILAGHARRYAKNKAKQNA